MGMRGGKHHPPGSSASVPKYPGPYVRVYSLLGRQKAKEWAAQGGRRGAERVGRLRVKVASRVQPHRRRDIRHCDRADGAFRSALYRPSALFFLTYPSCCRVTIFPPSSEGLSAFLLSLFHGPSLLSLPSAVDSSAIMQCVRRQRVSSRFSFFV